jgi:hypothetical protein
VKAIEHMFVSQVSFLYAVALVNALQGKEKAGAHREPRPRLATTNYFFFAAFLTFFTAFLTAFLTFFLAAIFLTSFH